MISCVHVNSCVWYVLRILVDNSHCFSGWGNDHPGDPYSYHTHTHIYIRICIYVRGRVYVESVLVCACVRYRQQSTFLRMLKEFLSTITLAQFIQSSFIPLSCVSLRSIPSLCEWHHLLVFGCSLVLFLPSSVWYL